MNISILFLPLTTGSAAWSFMGLCEQAPGPRSMRSSGRELYYFLIGCESRFAQGFIRNRLNELSRHHILIVANHDDLSYMRNLTCFCPFCACSFGSPPEL
jgi:hypothetical protein